MNYKNKSFMTKRKAFTLIELLIVIAIIGILFIVLVSKVDFATDKAKTAGVQTDFRSFQVAIKSVAKENAGLATFGWDTGDTNGDRIRNSYDKGDSNQNGKQDPGEVFVGSKTYSEIWTNVYTLTNPADTNDKSAIVALEEAINKNLDPKLHITIHDDLTITMANGAKDPWDTEYHGYYITNATVDNKDRGAIIMYSNGANQEWGSEHSIANGIVTITVPGNNVYGKDDYAIAVIYTYINGYGETQELTSGFSNNQLMSNSTSDAIIVSPPNTSIDGRPSQDVMELGGLYDSNSNFSIIKYTWDELIALGYINEKGSCGATYNKDAPQETIDAISGDLVIPSYVKTIPSYAFKGCINITSVTIADGVENISQSAFENCNFMKKLYLPNTIASINYNAFKDCKSLNDVYYNGTLTEWLTFKSCPGTNSGQSTKNQGPCSNKSNLYIQGNLVEHVIIPDDVFEIRHNAFDGVISLKSVQFHDNVTYLGTAAFCNAINLTDIQFAKNNKVSIIEKYTFERCSNLKTIVFPEGLEQINMWALYYCGVQDVTLPKSFKISTSGFSETYSLKTVRYNGTFQEWINISWIGLYANPLYYCSYHVETFDLDGEIPEIWTVEQDWSVVPSYAFMGINGLKQINLHNDIVRIEDGAFYRCKTLESVNNVPSHISYLGTSAFEGCRNLVSFVVPESITEISDSCFEACTSLTHINIPVGVTAIKNDAFANCTKLKVANLHDNIKSIGSQAFFHCESLENLYIPRDIETLGYRTFIACKSLKEITIPSKLQTLADLVFGDCTSLEYVYLTNPNPPQISEYTFSNLPNLKAIYVPSGSRNVYINSQYWNVWSEFICE